MSKFVFLVLCFVSGFAYATVATKQYHKKNPAPTAVKITEERRVASNDLKTVPLKFLKAFRQ